MNIKEIEVVKKENVYELTESELDAIKEEYRTKGRIDVANYIAYCIEYYGYKWNLGGLSDFVIQLCKFVNFSTKSLENVSGLSLFDYIEKYRKEK